MYMFTKLFSNVTTSFFLLLMGNLFIGIILSVLVFLLNFFQYIPAVGMGYLVTRVS